MSENLYANALEEMRVRDLRETFDAALNALTSPMASIPSAEWGGRKDMICPDDEDERLDFNRSGWSAELIASGPLGVRPEDSIVLTASAAAAIQQVLIELLQAATAAPPAQGIDLGQQQDAARWRAVAPLLSVEWDEDEQLKRWTWLDFKGDAPAIPSPTRQEYTNVDEAVDALIRQRDAAPGVGNG